jgi:hypothetical protein
MTKLAWKPWNKVVSLRDELRAPDLAMNLFAADLYDVVMGKARRVYGEPREFFALTYPTFNLRELARDVVARLANQNDKAVRQLELTYGGGKTHTLITLYHLVHDPENLPDLPAVQEFVQHIGRAPPRSRVAVLPFDKLDAETGMDVRSPTGEVRRLKNPWSVLAFQLAGADGLRRLHAEGRDAERESAPAEPLLAELLAAPARDGLPTLVLIDETLMYARQKVGLDPVWRGRLIDFFQYLTQAAVKVPGCAVVASLLATDPRKSDTLGKELTAELYAIFRREREESVQPVQKEDVAEVLRRRFFQPETVRDREAFRPHVVAALKGIVDLDEQTRRDGKGAEERYLQSYPFHPDLTEVLYSKWTQLESFQRTRGVLRTFALALRDAERWDLAPLVSANVFLGPPGKPGLSEAARELTTAAGTEEYEGKKQEWAGILEGELAKARDLQLESPGLGHRELEQAVFATFLHSQPIGHKAFTRDLVVLLGATRPDKIELEKGLRRWSQESWFLDDAGRVETSGEPAAAMALPRTWRLGLRPNLTQMHHDACAKVTAELIEEVLLKDIGRLKALSAVPREAGVRVHLLPDRPRDVEDDGEFHYAILGPKAASSSGSPSAEARRFLDEKTGPDAPRVYRNAVVLAVPAREGLDVVRSKIRDYLGWEEVQHLLGGQEIDPLRQKTLEANVERTRREIPGTIQQAYCIVVTVSDKNEAQAFKLNVTGEPLFQQIKTDPRSRIQDTAISAEALLPGGPYDLWHSGETTRRVRDLASAFAQVPRLPKMLRAREILETLRQGAREGWFVLRAVRPDHTAQTYWRQEVPEAVLAQPNLEVVLCEAAELAELPPALLAPQVLPGLWAAGRFTFRELGDYFAGGRVVKVPREGYEEPVMIPRAPRAVLEAAVTAAVREGLVSLLAGAASLCGEAVPAGLLTDEAVLLPPPPALPPGDLLPDRLPDAWPGKTTTALSVAEALGRRVGRPQPWSTVTAALNGAFQARLLERTADSGPWPCDLAGATHVRVRQPARTAPHLSGGAGGVAPPPQPPSGPHALTAQARLQPHQLQELTDKLSDLLQAVVGFDLGIHLRLELGGTPPPASDVVARVNALLAEVAPDLRFR